MPVIAVYPDVFRAYNRVEIDWADTPSVEWAKVTRVDAVTGQCTPLRPYICYNGDYLNVSCDGHGIFWDTEVPLDRSVYYITEALDAPCIPVAPVASDTFTRNVPPGGWGSADIGGPWSTGGGAGTDYFVNGARAAVSLGSVNTARRTNLGAVSMLNGTVETSVILPVVPTGNTIHGGVMARFMDSANFYIGEAQFNVLGNVTARIRKSVAGVFTTLASVTPSVNVTFAGGTPVRIKFAVNGSTLALKVWTESADEPVAWTATVNDTSFTTAGSVGTRSILATGNTNPLPVTMFYDDFIAYEPCEPCGPTEAVSGASTMPSNGAFRLKDPLRPCNDLYVPLCFTQAQDPKCLPGSGIFFAQMDTESYDANTMILNPTNAARPIAVSRTRRDRASLLQLVTRTFTDRDNLLRINEPGSPLLFQGPPDYGIPDTYMTVGTISVERGLTDHRFPVRINNLPFLSVDRPAGPSQGICGSRVEDSCDVYSTWQDITDAGLVYEDFVRGRASTEPGVTVRTWDDGSNDFVDWDAANAAGTWAEVKAGAS